VPLGPHVEAVQFRSLKNPHVTTGAVVLSK
jgi:hypothetical protein